LPFWLICSCEQHSLQPEQAAGLHQRLLEWPAFPWSPGSSHRKTAISSVHRGSSASVTSRLIEMRMALCELLQGLADGSCLVCSHKPPPPSAREAECLAQIDRFSFCFCRPNHPLQHFAKRVGHGMWGTAAHGVQGLQGLKKVAHNCHQPASA
jgi:hypothetical protein